MPTVSIPGPISPAKFLLVVVIWALIVFAFVGVTGTLNKQWTPPGGNANRSDQCELLALTDDTGAGTVLEHENTWSNAGYLLAGILILFCTCRPLGYVVGVQLCVLAFLSGMYHGTLQEYWQIKDVASIYFILWALLLYGLQAVLFRDRPFAPIKRYVDNHPGSWPWDSLVEWGVALLLGVLSSMAGVVMANNRTSVYLFSSTTATFTFVTALIVLCTFPMARHLFRWLNSLAFWRLFTKSDRYSTNWHLRLYFWGFMFFGGIGLVCRLNDGDGKPLCCPGAFIQAHAVWHVFGAVALFTAYNLFAWSSNWDWAVLAGAFPTAPETRMVDTHSRYRLEPVYVTALTSAILGAGLVALTFVPKAFVERRENDTSAAPIITGLVIAGAFLLLALVLFLLRKLHVIENANPPEA